MSSKLDLEDVDAELLAAELDRRGLVPVDADIAAAAEQFPGVVRTCRALLTENAALHRRAVRAEREREAAVAMLLAGPIEEAS
jgi:hypothetical protein